MTDASICPHCGARQRRTNPRFCQQCGFPLSPADTQPESSSRKRVLWIILLGLLGISGVIAAGFLFFSKIEDRSATPVVATTEAESPAQPALPSPGKPATPAPPTSTSQPKPAATVTQFPSTTTPVPVDTLTPVRSSPALASPTAQPGVTVTAVASSSPQIRAVDQRLQHRSGDLIIHKDIHFQDAEGDAAYVTYTVVQSDIDHYHVEDDLITASPVAQRRGAVVTASWQCGNNNYRITLRSRIVDRAGHESEPFDLTFDCHF